MCYQLCKYTDAVYAFELIMLNCLLNCLISCRFSSTKLFYSMTGQVLVESMDLSAHRLSVKTSVEDESERADSTISRWDILELNNYHQLSNGHILSVSLYKSQFYSCVNAVVSPYVMTLHQNYSEWPPSNNVDWAHRTPSVAEGRCRGECHGQFFSSFGFIQVWPALEVEFEIG